MIKFIPYIFLFFTPFIVHAESDIAMLIHGSSIHTGCVKGHSKKAKECDFNAFNPGLGIDWKVAGNQDTG
ncbi:MAG: hypothetical protein ACRCYN_11350, partial [Plesiomonas sp.]